MGRPPYLRPFFACQTKCVGGCLAEEALILWQVKAKWRMEPNPEKAIEGAEIGIAGVSEVCRKVPIGFDNPS